MYLDDGRKQEYPEETPTPEVVSLAENLDVGVKPFWIYLSSQPAVTDEQREMK